VTLPHGVTIDPGGIGKGLGGDIVARELLAAGADGVMVDLGGDVRVSGRPPAGDAWTVAIVDPVDPERDLAVVRLTDGAVATSSTRLRTWDRDGTRSHHLIDPATGRPRVGAVVAVTVIAGEGWWAEVSTKHALALGPAHAAGRLVNAAAVFVDATGRKFTTPDFERMAA
jgi:thiamine biosynthesis lipoprotein